jgi:Fe-S cluster assembly protein SufD
MEEKFNSLLHDRYKLTVGNDPLSKARAKAWDQYVSLGLPSRKMEMYRYIKMRHFFAHDYSLTTDEILNPTRIEKAVLPECKNSFILFINGRYHEKLSNLTALPKNCIVNSLNEASKSFNSLINNQWAKGIKEEKDPFAAINGALHNHGAFVYLPPNSVIQTPIQILHIVDTGNFPAIFMPRINLFVGSHSEVSFVFSTSVLSGSTYGINQVADIAIEENSRVKLAQISSGESATGWHLDALRVSLKRNSSFSSVLATEGSLTTRNDYRISLVGENSEALLHGIALLKDKREAHTHIVMDHQAPHCRSNQLFKSVLSDSSVASFEGKILVQKPAQKTEAFQLNSNLLLSEGAQANSKPNLEIFADDVKASHGATVGQLDPEQIFYMKARGLSEEQAKKMLIEGFSKEIFDLMPVESLKK